MKKIIEKVSIPLSGVMLGCASLGNLLQSYSAALRWGFGILAAIFLALLLLKIICFPSVVKEDMKNPILASVAATFPMSIMLLSVYAKPFIGIGAKIIWFLAIALHISIMIYFTIKFIFKFDVKNVFATYFIVYVGIAVAGITAPAYGLASIGAAAFWFAFVCLFPLLALVGFRYTKYSDVQQPAQPLFCIFAAPTNLCLAAYLQSVQPQNPAMVYFMMILAAILYLIVLVRLVSFLRLPFYPSYAAFTFPFVISAIALTQANGYLSSTGNSLAPLSYLITFETIIATVLVLYTVARYIQFLFFSPKMKTT